MHITCDVSGVFSRLHADGDDVIVVGGLTQLKVECNEKLRMRFHSTGDVDVSMHDVAFIPDLGLTRFRCALSKRGKRLCQIRPAFT